MSQAYSSEVLAIALPAMTRANPNLVNSGTFYVVEILGTIAGCGGWSFEAPGSGITTSGLAHIRHFAVDPQHVGNGIGRAIFEYSSKCAANLGANSFQALSSLNAEPFYARMGLKRLELISIPIGSTAKFPVVLMEGLLPSMT